VTLGEQISRCKHFSFALLAKFEMLGVIATTAVTAVTRTEPDGGHGGRSGHSDDAKHCELFMKALYAV
jgi:hypothetical protein